MSDLTYDISKLKESGELDVDFAIKFFGNQQAFFAMLTAFTDHADKYLTTRNPFTIFVSAEDRQGFLDELSEIIPVVESLGMNGASSDLINMKNAISKMELAALADELSKFHLRIKEILKHISSSAVTTCAVPVESPKKEIILAVDDKPALLSSVAEMLSADYRVMAVTSGMDALKAIERHTPVLFLLDIEMPVMDGFELAGNIRRNAKFRSTPIIFLTAKGSRDDVITAIQHGGNDYIVKPVDKNLLLEKVKKFLG